MDSTSHREAWDLYVQGITSADEQESKTLLAKTVSVNCVYTGPENTTRSLAELQGTAGGFREKYPNAKFRTVRFREHGGRVLADWEVVGEKGDVLVTGATFSRWDETGRIQDMTGFYDGVD